MPASRNFLTCRASKTRLESSGPEFEKTDFRSIVDQLIQQFAQTVRAAASKRTPLRVRGGGSKDFYGGELRGEILEVNAYRGIVDYEPTELVITARAGTPLDEIEATLRAKKQMLAFEPPHFDRLPSPLTPLAKVEGNSSPPSPSERRIEDEGKLFAQSRNSQ